MARTGRKRKPGKREPNGQLSRRKKDAAQRFVDGLGAQDRDTIAIGLAARIRVHGVATENVRDQMAGSYVGRLCLTGQLAPKRPSANSAMYDAAMTYLEDCAAYRMALDAPRMPGAVNLNSGSRGVNDYDPVALSRRAIERMDGSKDKVGVRGAIQAKQNELRGTANLWSALNLIVQQDRELPNLVGDLRYALAALVKHYGLEARVAA